MTPGADGHTGDPVVSEEEVQVRDENRAGRLSATLGALIEEVRDLEDVALQLIDAHHSHFGYRRISDVYRVRLGELSSAEFWTQYALYTGPHGALQLGVIADDPSRYQALLTQRAFPGSRSPVERTGAGARHVPTRPIDKRSPRRTWSGSLSPCSRPRRSDAVTGSWTRVRSVTTAIWWIRTGAIANAGGRAAVTGWSRPAKPAMTATSATTMPALAPSVLRLDAVTGTCRWASSDVMRVKPTAMCHPIPAVRTAACRDAATAWSTRAKPATTATWSLMMAVTRARCRLAPTEVGTTTATPRRRAWPARAARLGLWS